MGRSARNRKILAKLGPSPAELEQEKLINLYEREPNRHPLLCFPGIALEYHYNHDLKLNTLKVPVWISFGSTNTGDRKYDAYMRHVWTIEECQQAVFISPLYGGCCYSQDALEHNKIAWEQGKRKASYIFHRSGKLCEEGERYNPALNDPILKYFMSECIQRVLETMHIPHEQKIAAVGLMFAAWFQPKGIT